MLEGQESSLAVADPIPKELPWTLLAPQPHPCALLSTPPEVLEKDFSKVALGPPITDHLLELLAHYHTCGTALDELLPRARQQENGGWGV